MAFPNNVSAAIYSRFIMSTTELSATQVDGLDNKVAWAKEFSGASTNRVDLGNIRDMPSFGTPANIIKVPEFGRDQTLSIGAQPDAPDLEFTINFVGSDWDEEASATVVGDYVSDGRTRPMMISMLSSESSSNRIGMNDGTGISGALNATIFFAGRIESALFNPMRDDASTVTVALSVQSNFFGPVTFDQYTDLSTTTEYFIASNNKTGQPQPANASTPAGYTAGSTSLVGTAAALDWDEQEPYLWRTVKVSGAGSSTVWAVPTLVAVF